MSAIRNIFYIADFSFCGAMSASGGGANGPTLPTVDISRETERHVIIEQGTNSSWNGHPHTLLMPDGKTIFCVWQARRDVRGYGAEEVSQSRLHGAPSGFLKRSDDGGRTWSELLEVPDNWRTIAFGSPTIHRLVDDKGVARIFIFCRDAERATFLTAVSEDDGKSWSPMHPLPPAESASGPITGWTAPITILEATGPDGTRKHLMWYERARDGRGAPGAIWQSASYDGGLAWGESKPVVDRAGACEPAVVRSPDGGQLLLLIRENSRRLNSLYAVSDDEGESWSEAKELPIELTGDRHLPRYAPDGRLVIVFRPRPPRGDWENMESHCIAWVGGYEDIIEGRSCEYMIKLLHSYAEADHTYPGLELLPDGSLLATTYIKYRPGPELHSIVSVRFRLEETDERIANDE